MMHMTSTTRVNSNLDEEELRACHLGFKMIPALD